NRSGKRVFDRYVNPDQPWHLPADNAASSPDTLAFVVVKDGLKGLWIQSGKWHLPPIYQQIEYLSAACWKLHKKGKQTVSTPAGELLPYFDEIGYMDGRYFDVKSDGKWGIYDIERQEMRLPAVYDGFDYCSGCGRKSDYVYAQKNGKWGIVDF